jgi:hypothetical protein
VREKKIAKILKPKKLGDKIIIKKQF